VVAPEAQKDAVLYDNVIHGARVVGDADAAPGKEIVQVGETIQHRAASGPRHRSIIVGSILNARAKGATCRFRAL
jgi:hypothetical protein